MDPISTTKLAMPLADVAAIFSSLVLFAAWVLVFFESKSSAKERHAAAEKRMDATEKRVAHTEGTIQKVASDVSYIRGRLEPKD